MSETLTPVTSVAIKDPHYERVGLASLGGGGGVLAINSMAEAVSVAQLMAKSGIAIRKHLRDNPGACLGVLMQALRWEFDPYMVANKSYAVNDQLAYEAQLVAAVVLTRAAIVDEPDYEYAGDPGTTRTCTVTFKMRSGKMLSYTTPEVRKITVKNSPLWKSDEDQQLGYFAVRSWARRHQPHVLLGVYTVEEAHEIIDVTPGTSGVASRLPGAQNGNGFNSDNVHAETERAAPKAGRSRKPRGPERDEAAETPAPQEAAPAPEAPPAQEPETPESPPAASEARDPQEVFNERESARVEAELTAQSNLPAEMQTYIDAVESAKTFVEVKQAMITFFQTELFRDMDVHQQNHVRYQTWATLEDRKAEGDFNDLPDQATDVSAFRLWVEAQDDPEAITGTLAVLEKQPGFTSKDETMKAGIRKAAADRIAALR